MVVSMQSSRNEDACVRVFCIVYVRSFAFFLLQVMSEWAPPKKKQIE